MSNHVHDLCCTSQHLPCGALAFRRQLPFHTPYAPQSYSLFPFLHCSCMKTYSTALPHSAAASFVSPSLRPSRSWRQRGSSIVTVSPSAVDPISESTDFSLTFFYFQSPLLSIFDQQPKQTLQKSSLPLSTKGLSFSAPNFLTCLGW